VVQEIYYGSDLPEFAGRHRVGFAIFEPFYFDRMVSRHVTLQSGRVSLFGGNRSRSGRKQRRSCASTR